MAGFDLLCKGLIGGSGRWPETNLKGNSSPTSPITHSNFSTSYLRAPTKTASLRVLKVRHIKTRLEADLSGVANLKNPND